MYHCPSPKDAQPSTIPSHTQSFLPSPTKKASDCEASACSSVCPQGCSKISSSINKSCQLLWQIYPGAESHCCVHIHSPPRPFIPAPPYTRSKGCELSTPKKEAQKMQLDLSDQSCMCKGKRRNSLSQAAVPLMEKLEMRQNRRWRRDKTCKGMAAMSPCTNWPNYVYKCTNSHGFAGCILDFKY